ncbi:MAG: undecaprenyl-diphosphate phosphatase [Candidatus Bathyarchaeia archaeon]
MEAFLLGALQGVTEWLPVSSSGHLVILQTALGLTLPVFFDALLHMGTLLVTLTYYRADIRRMLKSTVRLDFKSDDGRYVPLILTGTVPTLFIVLIFREFLESLFFNLWAVAVAYLAVAPLLFYSRPRSDRDRLSYLDAFLIGFLQGVAVIPGISRSGATIGVGLMRGLSPKAAARYSFLLSVPSTLGAVLLESSELPAAGVDLPLYLAGMAVATAVGYCSLRVLLKALTGGRFHQFAYYCAALGFVLLLVSSFLTR